jgi:hypothetical protein
LFDISDEDEYTGSWEQLPEVAWRSIYAKFSNHSAHQGYPHESVLFETSNTLAGIITEGMEESTDNNGMNVDGRQMEVVEEPLTEGELVYFANQPAEIIRVGFASYADQVRVRYLYENHKDWTNGKWVACDACQAVRAPMRLQVTSAFQSANEQPELLRAGSIGTLIRFDKDGDLIVKFQGLPKDQFVFMEDAKHLKPLPS